jgi:DNA repair photolyase
MNYNQKTNVAYLTEEQMCLFDKLPEEVKIIMLGCDTEFFQPKAESLQILDRLSNLGKDMSLVTKMNLDKNVIMTMKDIDAKLNSKGNFLVFSETLTSMESAKIWEPKVPKPEKRIETLKKVHQAGIKTLVALRPLLPSVNDEELEEIIESTKDFCLGYYSGPLYLKTLDHPALDVLDDPNLEIEKIQPHWMPEGNEFYKVQRSGQMENLNGIITKHNKLLFEGAAEAIGYLKK